MGDDGGEERWTIPFVGGVSLGGEYEGGMAQNRR